MSLNYQYADMHCDTLLYGVRNGVNDIYEMPEAMLDIKRLAEAGVLCQFLAVFFPPRPDMLTPEQREKMLAVFLPDFEEITNQLQGCEDCILFLTEAFPNVDSVREEVAKEIVRDYCQGYQVVIKPHPRDDIDYKKLFADCVVIKGKFPIEVLNFIDGIHFKKAVSIITSVMGSIEFVDEKINIGPHIWDKYEPIENHILMNRAWDELHAKHEE